MIEVSGLRKEFTVSVKAGRLRRERRVVAAVDGIDLRVERGETLGYLGPNGAGKSTTLKMLTGVLTPSAGEISVCGLTPVPQRARLAYRIGVVFGQRSQLWWDLPLRDSYELLRHIYRVPAVEHAQQLRECVELLDLGPLLDTRYLSVRFSEHTIGRPALRWDGPGLSGGCRAGLTLQRHLPAYAGLLVGSTSCHRATPGSVELRREGG